MFSLFSFFIGVLHNRKRIWVVCLFFFFGGSQFFSLCILFQDSVAETQYGAPDVMCK
jgi:hypothetical protein